MHPSPRGHVQIPPCHPDIDCTDVVSPSSEIQSEFMYHFHGRERYHSIRNTGVASCSDAKGVSNTALVATPAPNGSFR